MISERANSATFRQLCSALLAQGFRFRFQARGRSMFPTIDDGEILHIESAQAAKLRGGDIVLFNGPHGLKVHRIVRRRGEFFITRGDSGVDNDGEIRREQVLGKVVAKECANTGQLVPLSRACDRARFFWRELRRSLSSLR